MTLVRVKLADIQTIAATAGSIYANSAGEKAFISGLTVHNTDTVNQTVQVYNVPDSGGALGTAALTNRIWIKVLVPDETAIFEAPSDGIVLSDTNDALFAVTTTASKVTLMLHGRKDVP
jgi:Zn-dependent M28 family amino/carboxypeptidase